MAQPRMGPLSNGQAINKAIEDLRSAGGENVPGLATTCLATVQPEPIRWLVPEYLPLGKLVLIAGDGGHGKTTITHGLAADLSRGRPAFGLDYAEARAGETLLISCEDDYADTVVPRLLSAGADLNKVRSVDGCPTKDGKPTPFCLAHYERLEEELTARPDVRLVVVDPAGAYIGRSGIDDNNDTELRSLLGPLAEMAARRRVTVLLVKHFIKGATAKAVHKVGGSAGYVNSVRAAFVVVPCLEEEGRRLFLPLKFNLGPKPSGLAYRMESLSSADAKGVLAPFKKLKADDRVRLGKQLFKLHWLGPVSMDADAALADPSRAERTNKPAAAAEWLGEFLAEFAYPSEEVLTAGAEKGFTRNSLFSAKKLRPDIRAKKQGRGEWLWGIGDPKKWVLRPEPEDDDDEAARVAADIFSDEEC